VRHRRRLRLHVGGIITRTCCARYWQSLTAPGPRMFSERENIAGKQRPRSRKINSENSRRRARPYTAYLPVVLP